MAEARPKCIKGRRVELVEARVKAALERVGYSGGDNLLVVAVSGGPDSLALLYALMGLRETAGLRLHVAHLDHDFRGEEAEEDARFVATVAHRLGLTATVEKADPTIHQSEMRTSSFEESARELRYSFLGRVARENGAAAVVLGHTADDLAETVLMRIIRGTGLHGLRAMVELSTWRSRTFGQEAVLFRPFLEATKMETAAYCKKLGIAFRDDSGNLLLRFTRNRVRHHLLPAMASYNPRIRDSLVRLAHAASLEVDYVDKELDKVWPTAARQEGDSILLDSRLLELLHPFMRRMVLRRAYQQLTGDTRRLEEAHLKAMEHLASAPPGKVLSLPRGLRLHTGYGQLILGREMGLRCPFPPLKGQYGVPSPSLDGPPPSKGEKITEIPGWHLTARLLSSCGDVGTDPFTAYFDLGALGDGAYVRARMPGDRFQPLGMGHEKKLQDFFVDEKVPRAWRDRIPLVVSARGIAWVVGYRIAEWGKVREDSRRICQLRLSLAD